MATISQINGKTLAAISLIDGKAKASISQVDGQALITNSVTFNNGSSRGSTGVTSGTVTVVGSSASFYATAILFGVGDISVSITVNGTNRLAQRTTAGTTNSTSFSLPAGTYSYSLDVTINSGSGTGQINYTQP